MSSDQEQQIPQIDFEEQERIRLFYQNFQNRAFEILKQEEKQDYADQIKDKLTKVNIFEKQKRQKRQIIEEERDKLIDEMNIHVKKCEYFECKDVYDQIIAYGIFAGSFKQDPLKFVGYKVYERRHKTTCPYAKTLNQKMLQTHRVLKEQLNKQITKKII